LPVLSNQWYGDLPMPEYCKEHPDTEIVVIRYCPICRAEHGGELSSARMTPKQRVARAKKAARARWKKAKAKA